MAGYKPWLRDKSPNTSGYVPYIDEDPENGSDVGNKMHRKEQHVIETSAKKPTKKQQALSYPDVRRWYDNVARGSPVTADVRLRRLTKFCEIHNMTPMELIELGYKDSKAISDLLQDHISLMEQNGNAPGYINTAMVAVKSWLYHFDIRVRRKLKIANANATPTLTNERVPESQELAELFSRATIRSGAMMALIGKSGLRPESLGNYNATDGLKIKDLPDLAVVRGLATFLRMPPMIVVRPTISKARHQYFTFMTDLGAKRLLAYLNDRILAGESLAPETPLIAQSSHYKVYRGNNEGKKFLTTSVIERDVRKTMRPRFSWRPYILRAFFDTQLLIAESRGKIAHDFRVFFMGHKGSMEAKYTTNKSILPKALLDEMRESFKRSQEFLDLENAEENPVEKKKEDVRNTIDKLTPEQLAEVQKLASNLAGCNTLAGNK